MGIKTKKKKSKMHRGIFIDQNGPYTAPYDTYRVIAFCPDIERYFRSVGQAKQYIDKHYNEFQKMNEIPF